MCPRSAVIKTRGEQCSSVSPPGTSEFRRSPTGPPAQDSMRNPRRAQLSRLHSLQSVTVLILSWFFVTLTLLESTGWVLGRMRISLGLFVLPASPRGDAVCVLPRVACQRAPVSPCLITGEVNLDRLVKAVSARCFL